jgi:hypothetical protein
MAILKREEGETNDWSERGENLIHDAERGRNSFSGKLEKRADPELHHFDVDVWLIHGHLCVSSI